MERGRPLLVGLVAALALAAPAEASLEVRISVVPSKPSVGKTTVVQVRPYWTYLRPDGSCCRLEPADVAYPFRLEAVSPAGRVVRLRVRRARSRLSGRRRSFSARAAAGPCASRTGGPTTARGPAAGL